MKGNHSIISSFSPFSDQTVTTGTALPACCESHLTPCMAEPQFPKSHTLCASLALWETLLNLLLIPGVVSSDFPPHPVLPLRCRLLLFHLPTEDLGLLWGSFQIVACCPHFTLSSTIILMTSKISLVPTAWDSSLPSAETQRNLKTF